MKIAFYLHYLLDPVYLLFLELPGIIVVYFQGSLAGVTNGYAKARRTILALSGLCRPKGLKLEGRDSQNETCLYWNSTVRRNVPAERL